MREIQAIQFASKMPKFDLEDLPSEWCPTRHMQIFWEAVSIITPEAERYVMRSVLAYRKEPIIRDNPWLGNLVREFIAQEAAHTRVHIDLNKALGIHEIEQRASLRRALHDLSDELSPLDALAVAAAMEHLFFSVIKLTFIDTGFYKDSRVDPRVLRVFLWHWCEELEHHSVSLSLLTELDSSYKTRLLAAQRVLSRFIPACTEIITAVERHHSPSSYRRKTALDIAKLLAYFSRGADVSSKFLRPNYDIVEAGKWSWPYIEEWRKQIGFADAVEIRSSATS